MTFKIFSIIVTVLFFWVIYPYKWVRNYRFKKRKDNAITECIVKAQDNGCRYFVVQNGREFYVGTRHDFRLWNTRNKKKMMPVMNFDYRNSIIYHCDSNGKCKQYERNAYK